MTKRQLKIEESRTIFLRMSESGTYWKVYLGKNMVEMIWAVPSNIPFLLARIAYYSRERAR